MLVSVIKDFVAVSYYFDLVLLCTILDCQCSLDCLDRVVVSLSSFVQSVGEFVIAGTYYKL